MIIIFFSGHSRGYDADMALDILGYDCWPHRGPGDRLLHGVLRARGPDNGVRQSLQELRDRAELHRDRGAGQGDYMQGLNTDRPRLPSADGEGQRVPAPPPVEPLDP